jgi:hypothetical protein
MLEEDNFFDTVPDSSLLGDFSSSHAEEFSTKSSAVPDSTSEHEPVKDQPSENTVNSDSPASVPAVPTLPTAEHEAAKDTTTAEHDAAKDTQSDSARVSNSKGPEQGTPVSGSSWITRLMILFMIFIAASVVVFPEIFTFLASLDFMGTMVWTSSVTGAALVSGRRLGQGGINTTSIGAFFVFIGIVCFFNGPPCRAAALQIDIQISGKEDTLLDHGVNFPLSGFSTPLMNEFQDQRTTSMSDFLLQKPVVLMMVTQGDSSNFEYKWCNDGGANKSVSGNRADFTGNFRSVDIDVIVAKKGIVMKAVGMGDCDLHCVDNLGHPCVVTLKDVLYIPGATKNLISSACLGQHGYQTVLPSSNPIFNAGLYLPQKPTKKTRFILFETINNLFFIATRNDMTDEVPMNMEQS